MEIITENYTVNPLSEHEHLGLPEKIEIVFSFDYETGEYVILSAGNMLTTRDNVLRLDGNHLIKEVI